MLLSQIFSKAEDLLKTDEISSWDWKAGIRFEIFSKIGN